MADEQKRVLLLVPTTSYRTRDFLNAAYLLGLDVVLGTDEKQALEEISDGGLAALDFDDPERGAEQIVALAGERGFEAVIGVDDGSNMLAARASERLGLANNPYAAVLDAKDKHRFRQRLSAAGQASPDYRLIHVDDDPSQIAREIAFPCVIKPLSLNMSRGVIRADGDNSFVAAFDRVKKIIAADDAKTFGDGIDHLLIESYIPGTEYAIEGLVRAGQLQILALFDKPDPMDGPFFEETIYVTPAEVTAETRAAIQAAAQGAVTAIELVTGPVHIDLRVNDDGVFIIELDARSIGGHCGRSLRFAGGMRLEEVILRHAIGLPIEIPEATDGAGGVMMIPIPRSGILNGVAGKEQAELVPLVTEVSIPIPVGREIVALPEGGRYLGFIIAHGPTAELVTQALRQSHALLSFDIS